MRRSGRIYIYQYSEPIFNEICKMQRIKMSNRYLTYKQKLKILLKVK